MDNITYTKPELGEKPLLTVLAFSFSATQILNFIFSPLPSQDKGGSQPGFGITTISYG
jgi:hypothetical protein